MNYREKILIVDDDPVNLKLLQAYLSKLSYHILCASSGNDALKKIKEDPPDLILLDIVMPDIDGYEVTKRLKLNIGTRDIPIILVTALDGIEDKTLGLEAGADEFINKPVDKAEIIARVNSLLSLKRYKDQLKARLHSQPRFINQLDHKKLTAEPLLLYTILLVEDNVKDARLLQMQLRRLPYEIKLVTNGEEAFSMIQREKIDLVLLDLMLPRMSGYELTMKIKELEDTKHIQIVAITSLSDIESRIKGIELGIDDYLVKPIHVQELTVRLNALIKKKAYLDSLYYGYRSAVHFAITDKLTGIYNYAYFTMYLENEVKRSKRHNHALSFIMIDIDDFKKHNDELGHLAGDRILKEFGTLISKGVREIDLCFRYGGEEFVIILPYTYLKAALVTAQRLQRIIANHFFLLKNLKGGRKITASMGISSYPSHSTSMEELINSADKALYKAKRSGKNCICVDKDMPA